MFPFLFLSQLNSSNSSSYLRVLQSNCQKGTAVEICTEIQSLTSKWPSVPKFCQIHRYSITGTDFPTEIMLGIGLRVSGVPTKAYFMYNNPYKLLTRIRADAGCVVKKQPRRSPAPGLLGGPFPGSSRTTWTRLLGLDQSSSQRLWSQDLFTCLEITEDAKEPSVMWVLPVIYTVRRISGYLVWILTILKIKTEKNLKEVFKKLSQISINDIFY